MFLLYCFILCIPHVLLEPYANPLFNVVSTTSSPQKNYNNNTLNELLQLHLELKENKIQLIEMKHKYKNLEKSFANFLNKSNKKPSESDLDVLKNSEKILKSYADQICLNITKENKQLKNYLEDVKMIVTKQLGEQNLFLKNLKKEISEDLKYQISHLNNFTKIDNLPKTCADILANGHKKSGIYVIKPDSAPYPFPVLCDMDIKGGGWVYFMKRFNGSQNFNFNWTEYKNGFGNLLGEFWLGLDHLHELTGSKKNNLLFTFSDWEGKTESALFKNFAIGDESERYKIKSISFVSGVGNSFVNHLNTNFSTKDNIASSRESCIKKYSYGSWWYGSGCFHAKLTGEYLVGKISTWANGIHYYNFHGYNYSLKEAAMLIRPQ